MVDDRRPVVAGARSIPALSNFITMCFALRRRLLLPNAGVLAKVVLEPS